MRRVALTVDLDPLWAYHRIHGLPPPTGLPETHLSRVAIPRFLDLFRQLGARATFFVVGRELEDPVVRELLVAAFAAGHELANHTEDHPYHFLDLPGVLRAETMDRCHSRLESLLGEPPRGFRAPGYHADGLLMDLLAHRGYLYDSSMLPSVPYYLAKAAAMTKMALSGRRSGARLHSPTDLLSPRGPYRPDPGRPWRRGAGPVLEIPAASLAGGLPLVGTFLGAVPPPLAAWLGRILGRRSFLTVEFHGIDLVDQKDGGLGDLGAHQPGLGKPWKHRRDALRALLHPLVHDALAVPLAEHARLPGLC